MTRSASQTATTTLSFWLGMQADQEKLYANEQMNKFFIVPDWPTVMTWNVLAQEAMKFPDNKLFMLAADDMIFSTPGWDKALLDHYNALENKIHVYALQDSRDKDGLPHPIVSREWIEAMGWAFPPYYLHWKIDTWTAAIAKANGVHTHLREYLLIHDKANDRGQPDETHSRIRNAGWLDRDNYVEKTCGYLLENEKKRLNDYLRGREERETTIRRLSATDYASMTA